MSSECDKYGLDPEIIKGDYAEAYQRWVHHFNKANDKVQECFKETAFVPFESIYDPGFHVPIESIYDPGFHVPNFKELAKSLHKNQREMNNHKCSVTPPSE